MKKSMLNNLRMKIFEHPFRKLTIQDREWVKKACAADGGIAGHIDFLCMLITQELYSFDSFKKWMGCVLKRPWEDDGKLYCKYPIGSPEKRKKAVEKIVKIYSKVYPQIVFFAASDENVAELQDMYGEKVTNIVNIRENQEYMLDVDEQINLEGPEFSSRRNKIRRFDKLNNWTYEEITKDNMHECFEINSNWYEGHERSREREQEQWALQYAFSHYDQFDFQGGILRIDGKAVAFLTGRAFNQDIHQDVYMCWFAKSLKEYRDAPMFLLHEFVKRNCKGYRYINYSEDLGIEGLRAYKMSLRPKFFTSFYYITVNLSET